jgi:Rrf2 family protein
MKITAQVEYGLRILLRISCASQVEGLSIYQLSEIEGITPAYAAKITRMLRMGGLITSRRGHKGGYILAKPANQILISEVMVIVGGVMYDDYFCKSHSGVMKICTNSVDCSLRSLWTIVQRSIDQILSNVTLADLTVNEKESSNLLESLLEKGILYSGYGDPVNSPDPQKSGVKTLG